MASSTTAGGGDIPTWDGNASSFEAFAIACKWYQRSLKDSEQKLAASKVWQRLSGAAKAVVKHLPPEDYEDADGLSRLLDVLRASPLQQLPVPDSFSRLESWHHLKRQPRESIPELLVREEDLFVQLQQSLERARVSKAGSRNMTSGLIGAAFLGQPQPTRVDPPSTPSQSPVAGARGQVSDSADARISSFFEDELRGYRLLKAARLSTSERQNVLTQTANSTHYHQVRLALRTLFSDDVEASQQQPHERRRTAWMLEEDWGPEAYAMEDGYEELDWQQHDWSPVSWDDGYEPTYWQDWSDPWVELDWQDEAWPDDFEPDATSEVPEEKQFQEAFALANEAQRTLREARDAVKRVRAARGYYSPESASGKGMTPTSSMLGKGKGKKGDSGKGKTRGFGPCFICGKNTHGYAQCPDRFGGKGKGKKGKGFGKSSKGKGKSGGKASFFVEPMVFTVHWDSHTLHGRGATRAIIDTGATENAVGINALSDLVNSASFSCSVSRENLPTFRFGNGLTDRAVSRVDLEGTSLGSMSFFVLDGTGASTPPLIGAKLLRKKNVLISYHNGMFVFQPDAEHHGSEKEEASAVQLEALSSGHLTIDLAAEASPVTSAKEVWTLATVENIESAASFEQQPPHEQSVFVMSPCSRMSSQAHEEFLQKSIHPVGGNPYV